MNTAQYFYRNVIFSKSNGEVALVDIYNPDGERQVLESWFGNIFQLADGQHSVDELIVYVSNQYKEGAPFNLEETIVSVIERMVESKLLVLTDVSTDLPYYLSLPFEQLDLEKAKKILEEDRANLN